MPDLINVIVPFMDEHLPLSYKRNQYLEWREKLLDYWETTPNVSGPALELDANRLGEPTDSAAITFTKPGSAEANVRFASRPPFVGEFLHTATGGPNEREAFQARCLGGR